MLGFADPAIAVIYLLMFGSAVLCIVYGFVKWNKEGEVSPEEFEEEKTWASEELKIDKKITGEDEP